MVFFDLAVLHSCQLKTLVTTGEFNTVIFLAKMQPSSLQQYKKIKFFAGAFHEFLQKLRNLHFPEHFLLNAFTTRKAELTCLVHTALFSNAFLMKRRIKENSTLESERFCCILLFFQILFLMKGRM